MLNSNDFTTTTTKQTRRSRIIRVIEISLLDLYKSPSSILTKCGYRNGEINELATHNSASDAAGYNFDGADPSRYTFACTFLIHLYTCLSGSAALTSSCLLWREDWFGISLAFCWLLAALHYGGEYCILKIVFAIYLGYLYYFCVLIDACIHKSNQIKMQLYLNFK